MPVYMRGDYQHSGINFILLQQMVMSRLQLLYINTRHQHLFTFE